MSRQTSFQLAAWFLFAVSTFAEAPKANLAEFREHIEPLLKESCVQCHGPEKQKGKFRVDTLDPDMITGDDASWWVEVFDVISNGEMPPEDDVELAAEGRSQIVDWLSKELQVASQVARSEQGHSSFRRMTHYEYNYALQDLLGLPYDYAADLPPETESEDGFLNSSEMLQMSAMQFETYREIARKALLKATVSGEQPEPVHYAVTMDRWFEREVKRAEGELKNIRKKFENDPDKLQKEIAKFEERRTKKPGGAHYRNLGNGEFVAARWGYGGASYAWKPVPELDSVAPNYPNVAVIPMKQRLIVDLGDHLPAEGSLRMRIRAGHVSANPDFVPTLRVYFGHQASNNSKAEERVGETDIVISAAADSPEFYEFEIPLSEVVRNPFRGIQPLGKTPNPAEYVMLMNSSENKADIEFDYLEITAPFFQSWPPKSHTQILGSDDARQVLANFMARAWRRPPTDAELDQKLELFNAIRPECADFREAMVEVLATVLSSPKFLYLVQSEAEQITDFELATRLSAFLWASVPDRQLLSLAGEGSLKNPDILAQQTERMLNDPRASRFSKHFVRQWLGMQLLDHLKADRLNEDLREVLEAEPVVFFEEVLRENHSVMDFLDADYAMVNQRLAQHYRLPNVIGNEFRRVALPENSERGGLLTQAGLLAMNSDGVDSHPLKRGIWLLESILNDPPPPPPPAVPEIDLSDPEILKLTLKERMEDHRNDPACMSCHQRIDPWGIAFEHFDAIGSWRTSVNKKPVDATSTLFNGQELAGADGLKEFLLANRQDQFARALTHKLMSYALGRPLSFADRADVEQITAELRAQDDGLETLINLIVQSDLFLSK